MRRQQSPATTSKFDDDADGVLDAGEERPRFFAQVSCTFTSVRQAPRQDRHSGVERRTAVADGANDDNEGRRRSNPDEPVVDNVDDRSPPPPSQYRSNFNWSWISCTLIVARATSDNQDNDDDDDDGTTEGRTTTATADATAERPKDAGTDATQKGET